MQFREKRKEIVYRKIIYRKGIVRRRQEVYGVGNGGNLGVWVFFCMVVCIYFEEVSFLFIIIYGCRSIIGCYKYCYGGGLFFRI